MSWKVYDEAIEMLERRFQYFPRAFRWRGRRYEVEAVEQCWTVSRRGWKRRVERHFFRVHCAEGLFELFQDLRANTWHLRRAKAELGPLPGARRVAPAWH
jgi:hypothetical protein